MYEILNDKGAIFSFAWEEEALKVWNAIIGNKEAFESIEEYEKVKKEYGNFYSEGDLKLVKVLEYFR